jgi:hypothetical protein
MCSTVRNAKESYNELHQVKALVPIAHITDSAAHAHSLRNLVEACNSILQLHVCSIRTCTCMCCRHHCFDLAEHVVALFAFLTMLHTSAALVLSHTYAVAQGDRICRVSKCAQVCMTNIDPHLCHNPRPGRLRSLVDAFCSLSSASGGADPFLCCLACIHEFY